MSLRKRVLTGAVIAALPLTAALMTPGAAFASSTGCAFTNGCATLHGVDAASHGVAMDSKYQSAATGNLIIGYPDNSGDGATDFDAVLHYTPGGRVTTYSDTGFTLSPTFTSIPCLLTTDPEVAPSSAVPTTAGGNILTVQSTTGTVTDSPSSGSSIVLGGNGTAVLDEEYASDGASCQAAYSGTVSGGSFSPSGAPDTAPLTFPTSPGNSTWTFLDSDSGGTFSFTGLPSGVSHSGGSLTADTSTAAKGTYSNVGVTYTATDGAVFTATFTLTISATKSVSPGAPTPYYTFAYAKAGVWSNECVTDTNGSGALTLETCTLGHDHYQDFYALQGGVPQGNLQSDTGGTYHIQNLLSAYGSPDSCLIDSATVNPATPETNAFDEAIGGRQLAVTGSCTSDATSWSWSS